MSLFFWASPIILLFWKGKGWCCWSGPWKADSERTEVCKHEVYRGIPWHYHLWEDKRSRTGQREKVGTTRTSAYLMGSSGAGSVDSTVVRNWAKELAFLFSSWTIRFRLSWEGDVTQLMKRRKLSFALLASTTPEAGRMRNSVPGRKDEAERLFPRLLLCSYDCSYPQA